MTPLHWLAAFKSLGLDALSFLPVIVVFVVGYVLGVVSVKARSS